MPDTSSHPHGSTPTLRLGAGLTDPKSALILLHGRGASAQDMEGLAQAFHLPGGMAVLAPQAAGNSWYPERFVSPLASNEPSLSSALRRVSELVELLAQQGVPADKVIVGGFSQGACLASEFILRSPQRWGGLIVFSGGYIGPLGLPRQPQGRLDGTPAFLGCSDRDPHIPLVRVEETGTLLTSMGASVTMRIYPNLGHTIIQDEINIAQQIVSGLEEGRAAPV